MAKANIEYIREKAREKGCNLPQLEKAVGIANGIIGKWENQSPTLTSLEKVATYLGCNVTDLIYEEES